MTNPHDQAYPGKSGNVMNQTGLEPGLTKREYFAAMALNALCGWDAIVHEDKRNAGKIENIIPAAVKMADALIAELNK